MWIYDMSFVKCSSDRILSQEKSLGESGRLLYRGQKNSVVGAWDYRYGIKPGYRRNNGYHILYFYAWYPRILY